MKNSQEFSASKLPVSVVMPVFNAETYVGQAIDSILQQTFRDFELILIDDGSTDRTLVVLQEYAARDARIVLVTRNNKGLVDTLNEGVAMAVGEWIVRMDADDISLPHRFARQLSWLEKSGADVCGSWVRLFGVGGERVLRHAQTDAAIKLEMLFGTPFAHPTVMVRAALLKKMGYDKAWEKCEDYDLWERAARNGWLMTNVPEVLLLYRQHVAQISSKGASMQQMLSQRIRRRYWNSVSGLFKLEVKWIDEVIKLRETPPQRPDMDLVDLAFEALLESSHGEAREIVFDHVTRLYFRAAGLDPSAVTRWGRLNKRYGGDFALATKVKLLLLGWLRIRPDGALFDLLKKIQLR